MSDSIGYYALGVTAIVLFLPLLMYATGSVRTVGLGGILGGLVLIGMGRYQ